MKEGNGSAEAVLSQVSRAARTAGQWCIDHQDELQRLLIRVVRAYSPSHLGAENECVEIVREPSGSSRVAGQSDPRPESFAPSRSDQSVSSLAHQVAGGVSAFVRESKRIGSGEIGAQLPPSRESEPNRSEKGVSIAFRSCHNSAPATTYSWSDGGPRWV